MVLEAESVLGLSDGWVSSLPQKPSYFLPLLRLYSYLTSPTLYNTHPSFSELSKTF